MSGWRSLLAQTMVRRLIGRGSLRIHLLDLRDGSPHSASPSNDIAWACLNNDYTLRSEKFAITGSRVMVCVFHLETVLLDHRLWTLLVWDRKTGDLVRMLWFGSGRVSDSVSSGS